MADHLTRIPVEVLDLVLNTLDFCDTLELRLTCRTLSAKTASTQRFKSFCTSKSVDLVAADLRRLHGQLTPGAASCHLEELTITGIVYGPLDPQEPLRLERPPLPLDWFSSKRELDDLTAISKYDKDNVDRAGKLKASSSNEAESALLEEWREHMAKDVSTGEDVRLLSALFAQIRVCTKLAGLKTVKLGIAVYWTPDRRENSSLGAWNDIMHTATHTYEAVLQAWKQSELPIDHLDIFSRSGKCSVPSANLISLDDDLHLGHTLASLKRLSLSITDQSWPSVPRPAAVSNSSIITPPDGHDPNPVATGFQWTPDLEALHLHHYHVYPISFRSIMWQANSIIRQIADREPLRHLQMLTLRNFTTPPDALLRLLQNSPQLRHLTLYTIELYDHAGPPSWTDIFAHICGPAQRFSQVYLDILWQGPGFVWFPHRTAYPGDVSHVKRAPEGWFTAGPLPDGHGALDLRTREQVLHGIEYAVNGRPQCGCWEQMLFREQQSEERVPPGWGGFDTLSTKL